MISVIVYTLNAEQTIEWCLQSLTTQHNKTGFEVVVIDDCSSDRTAEIVTQQSPQFRLVKNERTQGWVGSLRQHLPTFQGNILAFLGSHCSARAGWLAAIEEELEKGFKVITGMGYHGEGRLLDRFVVFSTQTYWETEREVDFVWDDNFALMPTILERALPQTDVILSDGAGAGLLSRNLKNMGITIHYRPLIEMDHIGNPLGRVVGLWYKDMAENAIAMRRVDRSIPGARLLRLGPIVAAMITAGRLIESFLTMVRTRRSFNISIPEFGFHTGLLVCLMPVYFLGLCWQLIMGRRQVES